MALEREFCTGVPGEAARFVARGPGSGLPLGARVEAALLDGGRLLGVGGRLVGVGVGQAGVLAQRRLDGLGHVVEADEALDGAHLEPAAAARLRAL